MQLPSFSFVCYLSVAMGECTHCLLPAEVPSEKDEEDDILSHCISTTLAEEARTLCYPEIKR